MQNQEATADPPPPLSKGVEASPPQAMLYCGDWDQI